MSEETRKLGRRNFLKAMAALPAAAAFPFALRKSQVEGGPVKVGFVGTGNEGRALLNNADPDFVKVVAVADIFPPNREIGHRLVKAKFDPAARAYDSYAELLKDPEVEAVITACPLFMHHRIVMDSLDAGKHVLCEKLIARTIEDGKEMVAHARQKNLILQIGHQRHYSGLYHYAVELIRGGLLGDIRHIHAWWHRSTKWTAPISRDKSDRPVDPAKIAPADIAKLFGEKDKDGRLVKGAAWEVNGNNTSQMLPEERAELVRQSLAITEKDAEALKAELLKSDWATKGNPDKEKYGYPDYEHLRNWRLYRRHSQGLMGELGSHQMDACGIILDHAHPLWVTGTGNRLHNDGRDVNDHVYCQFGYPNDVIVTYSSISSNAFAKYGEHVHGTKGTLIIEEEKDIYFIPSGGGEVSATDLTLKPSGRTAAETSGSAPAPAADAGAASLTGKPVFAGRGYKEEIQHFAVCVRSKGADGKYKQTPVCDGVQALGDAVIAIKANEAIDTGARIKFEPEWFTA